ncbi:Ig-like domain-containing protein [Kutzneria buriramensis]|uniref:Lipoprotein-anchoring transpeptidase ErfK/SrfK n=1 Tax=Kutzneria buriramensis TaxID=1045776 RepID=A0A3E0GWX4_9PSEU|nr:Ig-like domain-containing protein [Kutzneria buriramensis]REH32633.1 lipoprotein-anchoring transpeptidase ErfK/SrfK [Kutzneria buriramensis]
MKKWPAIVMAASGLLVAACSPGGGGVGSALTTTTTPPPPPAKAAIAPAAGGQNVATDSPITVTASGGTITDVEITGGGKVSGSLSPDKKTWTSTGTLNVSATYTVNATVVNSAGKSSTATSSFTTLTPTSVEHTHIFEAENTAYGVGMPIMLTFDKPVANKAAVEQALSLTTSQPVVGAWAWADDTHVDFRPRDYWPANTTVSFAGHLNGVQVSPGVYGAADLTQTFSIGDSIVVVAGAASHHMQVYKNGALQYDWPISTGKPGHDTPNGTYLTIEKGNPVEMKPADIAPGGPGYYDLKVPWSVRFTWSGDYLHDAYWSVGDQGNSDVSHGCVNMPPEAAQAYYEEELPGDPVTINGSPLAGTRGDGWTDWFDSWQDLLGKSATHMALQAGPSGSTFVAPASVAASAATAPTWMPAANNAAAA